MSSPVNLRILFGGDEDSRKLTLKAGIPASVDELLLEIQRVFGLKEQFRLQYKDVDFGNEYMNLMSTSEIQDKDTLKLIFLPCDDTHSSTAGTSRSVTPVRSAISPSGLDAPSQDQDDSFSSSDTIILHVFPPGSLGDHLERWPALFTVSEVNAEFMRITTVPLQSTFMAQLDRYTADLTKVFSNRGGAAGKKIEHIMELTAKGDDIHTKRDCVLRNLCVYLNEDSETLIKEYVNHNMVGDREKTTMGLHVVRREGADAGEEPDHVGVVIEGVELLSNLGSVSFGCAMLFGLIYTLNLSYPQGLKFTFEFFQKVLMNMDGKNLSPKVQALKIKMFQ